MLVPAVVGVPVINPVEPSKVKPAGKTPTVIFQTSGDFPPLVTMVWLYARFTVPSRRLLVVITSAGYITILRG